MSVGKASPAVLQADIERRLPRALMRGTTAMRAARTAYLPREPAESAEAYEVRLNRSFLFNGFGKTVKDMAGKVFAKPIILSEDMPDTAREYAENIDLAGNNLDVFAHAVFVDALVDGVSYILVDMPPPVSGADGEPVERLSRADAAGRRPWAVHVRASQVLGWQTETVNGATILTQFRFKESVSEQTGEFEESLVEQIRVLSRSADGASWATYRKSDKGEWLQVDGGPITIGEIAVTAAYTNAAGFFHGLPPLSYLAEVNLSHWQSQSDQKNILHVARVPILFGAGFNQREPITISAARMVTASDPNAKMTYVEHSGAAIESGRSDLKDLEMQIQALGLDLLKPGPGAQSATSAVLDSDRHNSPLAMMALALKDSLEGMFGFFAMYDGLARDTQGGSLTVNTDYGASWLDGQDVPGLMLAVDKKIITRRTALSEMKRRGIVSDAVDVDAEIDAALSEGVDDGF